MNVISFLIGIIIGLVIANSITTKTIIHGPRSKDIVNRIFYYNGFKYRLYPVLLN